MLLQLAQSTKQIWHKVIGEQTAEEKLQSLEGISYTLKELVDLRFFASKIKLRASRASTSQRSGFQRANLRGRGIDFSEVRAYQAGDDIRNMDWRVTARTGKPHTKLFIEERERPVYLLIDQTPSMFFGTRICFKSALASKIAALLAWSTIANGDRLGASVLHAKAPAEFAANCEQRKLLALLKSLANRRHIKQTSAPQSLFTIALQRLSRQMRPGSMLILISDFWCFSDEAMEPLSLIAKRNEVIACQISDPLEQEAPKTGYYTISDGEKFTSLDTTTAQNRQHYQQVFTQHQIRLKQAFGQLQAPLLQFTTAVDPLPKLARYFSKQSGVRSGVAG